MKLYLKDRPTEILAIDGVDPNDYPDFADAYISDAIWLDTNETLTYEEMQDLTEYYKDVVDELAIAQVF